MSNSVAIIGAGIAGLAAGCYGQMNGYETRIFEMHDKPGGLCTAWRRRGYTVDGCIHWLVGSAPGHSFHTIWQELGAVQGRRFVDRQEFLRIEGRDGRTLVLYTNLNRLQQHMHELSPSDGYHIDRFIDMAKTCAGYDMPIDTVSDLNGPTESKSFLADLGPYVRMLARWRAVTIAEFASRFSDRFLRGALPLAMDMPGLPIVALAMTLGWMHRRSAGYPLGGSLPFARSIEHRYRSLGGEVYYNAPVRQVLVENNRAVGVRLASGEVHRADTVISAADGHATVFDMLGGRYADDTIIGFYDDLPVFPSMVHVVLGVALSFEAAPTWSIFPLKRPCPLAGRQLTHLSLQFSSWDPSFAPRGKTAVKVMLDADYHYWRGLAKDQTAYNAEKERAADTIVSLLDERYPGFAKAVEMRDVATPVTIERYTGNWKGSTGGWLLTGQTMPPFQMGKTLAGLERFYMVGQWVQPGGGVQNSALSGRNVVRLLCERDRRSFATCVP